jgi:hypothetical protein
MALGVVELACVGELTEMWGLLQPLNRNGVLAMCESEATFGIAICTQALTLFGRAKALYIDYQ